MTDVGDLQRLMVAERIGRRSGHACCAAGADRTVTLVPDELVA